MSLSTNEIIEGKQNLRRANGNREPLHEHDDCIRIAHEWFDAQTITKVPTRKNMAIKHIIENWAGRYISKSDVEVAAALHPKIRGIYPHFNIDARLTRPSDSRLADIPEAKTQHYKSTEAEEKRTYSRWE